MDPRRRAGPKRGFITQRRQRNHQLRRQACRHAEESARRHPNDREDTLTDPYRPAKDRRICGVALFPASVADHSHPSPIAASYSVVGWTEYVANGCRHSERREEAAARQQHIGGLQRVAPFDAKPIDVPCKHVFEQVGTACADVRKDRVQECRILEIDEPLWFSDRQALQNETIDESEDAGSSTDADPHHKNHRGGEPRLPNDSPERVCDVAAQVLEARVQSRPHESLAWRASRCPSCDDSRGGPLPHHNHRARGAGGPDSRWTLHLRRPSSSCSATMDRERARKTTEDRQHRRARLTRREAPQPDRCVSRGGCVPESDRSAAHSLSNPCVMPLRQLQDALNGGDQPLELRTFSGQAPFAGGGQRVEPRAPIVLRRLPTRL